MKTSLVLFGVLAWMAGVAAADPNDLTGGVLITHRVVELTYTDDGPDWCNAYYAFALNNSADQVARIDGPLDRVVWYVLAAWDESKMWHGCEFGFANYNGDLFGFQDFGPCYPEGGGLEIPTSGWPGPNQGTAFVATTGKWGGTYTPIYWFAGYAYAPTEGSTVIQIGVDPATGVLELVNCQSPAQTYTILEQNRGGLGINIAGVDVHPGTVIPERACCAPSTHGCTIRTEVDCLAQGGEWHTEWTSCSPNPCVPTGACCYGTTTIRCAITTEADCLTRPHPVYTTALWKGEGIPCDPYPCLVLPAKVCCKPDGSCQVLTVYECDAVDGTWHEDYNSCSQAQCGALGACCIGTTGTCVMAWVDECKLLNSLSPTYTFPPGHLWHPARTCDGSDPCFDTPVTPTTWGRVKQLYR